MSELIRVPDIGGEGEVIEILVKEGDHIEAEQSLLTLESDKASMEIPAPRAGVIKSLKVKLGDKLKEGDALLELDSESQADAPAAANPPVDEAEEELPQPEDGGAASADAAQAPASAEASEEIRVPDLGSDGKARVIEILVKEGEQINADQSLVTLESDKASMEIPSPKAGTVERIAVQLDAEVGKGDLILHLRTSSASAKPQPSSRRSPSEPAKATIAAEADRAPAPTARSADPAPVGAPSRGGSKVHAGPAVRMLARELGVDLGQVSASGPKERILKEDVQGYVKQRLNTPAAATSGSGIPAIPAVDFSRFGETEEVPMGRLMRLASTNLHRSWLNIPHVTQFDSVDISDVEEFRQAQKAAAEKAGVKLTLLPILLKACARLLREMPDFNSSLAPSGEALIRKKYVHIGFAVDTPGGLLVPVIRDVDSKSLLQLAGEAAELAEKARSKKLSPDAMQGACFTITSLGHIGGTGFTPIINPPEVAILGVSRSSLQPVWDGKAFQPRMLLPLSLSYDHRVINGAAAARFTRRLGDLLGDIRTLLL
ncbi:dihydrolipoyllysine-residue acetyltransferase [Pseudomonas mangrovi]|uniref:Acetyltransferase component of pyruvate dehydrogenase complex n=1 Tax=Pseudomonas mangrovi TaxID=2161748 RepID=A0A2T5PFJ9_9PSED|nr:dihydrolipoyllysine-residue acetyltransferase [Pseudomonas mangrovi]PTU76507.1 dihydrolipoyllysine-residue acetyltransferase [Pseudomonas mangrovi]